MSEVMEYIRLAESALDNAQYTPLRVVFLALQRGGTFYLKQDGPSGTWELPAVGIAPGESPGDCARALGARYGLWAEDIGLAGLRRVVFEKTDFRPEPGVEYLALFVGDAAGGRFQAADEPHRWHSPGEVLQPLCKMSEGLMEWCLENQED